LKAHRTIDREKGCADLDSEKSKHRTRRLSFSQRAETSAALAIMSVAGAQKAHTRPLKALQGRAIGSTS
jgi:hypothetical protein